VQNGARAGAEAYAIDQAKLPNQARSRAIDEMSRTPGMNCQPSPGTCAATIAFKTHTGDGSTDCTVSPPTIDDPCFVTIRVTYQFRTIIPWPLIPNTANFDRSTTMRLFY
jgi:hypothetical protein